MNEQKKSVVHFDPLILPHVTSPQKEGESL
jgi:hypothetical protein